MKKILALFAAAVFLMAAAGFDASAQGRFGVIGGMTFSNAERQALNRSTMNKYHVGVTYQLKLPLGLSIQPSLMYHVKGAKLGDVIPGAEVTNVAGPDRSRRVPRSRSSRAWSAQLPGA